MEFECKKTDLLINLQRTIKAIAANAPYQLLECVQLVTKDNKLELTCTNSSLFIRSTLKAEVKSEGEVLLPGKLFTEMVNKMPDGNIKVSMNDNYMLKLKASNTVTNIAGQNTSDFPVMKTMYNAPQVHLPKNKLKDMINHVSFATAITDSTQVLSGCLISIKPDSLSMVALDGFRLAMQTYNDDFILPNGEEKIDMIVPGKILNDISHMISDTEDMLTLHIEKTHLMVVIDDTIIVTSLLAGSFVNYEAILPKTWNTAIKMKRRNILDATLRAELIASKAKTNIVVYKTEDNCLKVTSASEMGDVLDEVEAEIDGDSIEIAFNGKYIEEILKCIDDEYITFFITSATSPCVIKQRDGGEYTYLVMSVRI